MLVIQPIGGPDDWRALFHEAGHTEHFAHTRASLSVEERRLGDSAVTEGWAMLLEHLINDPAWLTARLDFPRPEVFAAEGAAQLLCFVRRYCAKLLYELEFHSADDVTAMGPRYVEILADARRSSPAGSTTSATSTPASTLRYLRAWAFEAQLARTCGTSSERMVRAPRGRRPSCVSSGARDSAGRPRTSSATSRARIWSWSRSPSARAAPRSRLSAGFRAS